MFVKSVAEFCSALGLCTLTSVQIVIYYRRSFSTSMFSMHLTSLMIIGLIADQFDPFVTLAVLLVGGQLFCAWKLIRDAILAFREKKEFYKFVLCFLMLLSIKMKLAVIFQYSNEMAFIMLVLVDSQIP